MSLTSLIKGTSGRERQFQEIVRSVSPVKREFKTRSGEPAFSAYSALAPSMVRVGEAGVVGTAFDYVARAMIAQRIHLRGEEICSGLAAAYGLAILSRGLGRRELALLKRQYDDAISAILEFVDTGGRAADTSVVKPDSGELVGLRGRPSLQQDVRDREIEALIPHVCLLAKLDAVYRSPWRPRDVNREMLAAPARHIVEDLQRLCAAFEVAFIGRNVIKEDSLVIFNPTFGSGSALCGGADGDVWIDGTLYDVKTIKSTGFRWQDSAQLMGYFLLSRISAAAMEMPWALADIDRIAIYRARYGQVEYAKIANMDPDAISKAIDRLVVWGGGKSRAAPRRVSVLRR